MSRYNPLMKKQAGSINRAGLHKGRPEKTLITIHKKHGGRNNLGRITCQTKGGEVKRFYRHIDFLRKKYDNVNGTVLRLEYDPNRTAFIALIEYHHNDVRELTYIIAPKGLKVGDVISSGTDVEPRVGNCLPLDKIPNGLYIHCVELQPGKGAKFARSAGSHILLSGKENGQAILKMSSGETRYVSLQCRATIGTVSNEEHVNDIIGQAGRSRHLGIRPKNRGICRNPVDHPNGGRTSGGKVFTNVTGKVIKGKKTVKRINPLIIHRRTK